MIFWNTWQALFLKLSWKFINSGFILLLGAWALWSISGPKELEETSKNGHACGDTVDLVEGKPTGAIRISLGWCSSFEDVAEFLAFIKHYFVETDSGPEKPSVSDISDNTESIDLCDSSVKSFDISRQFLRHNKLPKRSLSQDESDRVSELVSKYDEMIIADGSAPHSQSQSNLLKDHQNHSSSDSGMNLSREGSIQEPVKLAYVGVLKMLCLFPVKSCSAQQVHDWPVGPNGLLFDRHWAILDQKGRIMTLHRHPSMALIRAR